MEIYEDNPRENQNVTEHSEKREKVFVPVRCHKPAQEETPAELDRDEVHKIPRRWYIY